MDRKYTPRVSCLASLGVYRPELRQRWVTLNRCRASRAHRECADREIERTKSTLEMFREKEGHVEAQSSDEGTKGMLNSCFTMPAIPRLAIPNQHLRYQSNGLVRSMLDHLHNSVRSFLISLQLLFISPNTYGTMYG